MTRQRKHSSRLTNAAAPEATTGHPLSPGGETHVLFDTNVLLPPRLSDILLDAYLEGLFWARWSAEIEAEFIRNWPRVVTANTDATSEKHAAETLKAYARLACYKAAVPGHEIIGHNTPSMLARVPSAVHARDKHVAAAALVLADTALPYNASDKVYIVSSNLRHLAVPHMAQQSILVVPPGRFIDNLTQVANSRVRLALERCVQSLSNPPYTRERLVEALLVHGATSTAQQFALDWGDGHAKPGPTG
jgi:hypothetical protein